ncbi:ABC transporter permease, partial [candidate division KSB1 bacterium]
MKNKPPITADLLIRLFSKYDDEFDLCNTLHDLYFHKLSTGGRLRADLWYWKQVFNSIFKNRISNFIWSAIMLKNYLKIALRNIIKNKTYSTLNILGFAVGIAAYILIGLYVNYELSYDKHHENADSIYLSLNSDSAFSPAPFAPTLMREFPEVESATCVSGGGSKLLRYGDKAFNEEGWIWADKYMFDVFTFPLVAGDKNTALEKPYSIVITEEMAEKYFGSKNPVNEILNCTFSDGTVKDFTVTGVLKNIPENSYIKGDFLAGIETMNDLGRNLESWREWGYYIFYRLGENADPVSFEEKYSELLKFRLGDEYNRELDIDIYSEKLTDLHLSSNTVDFMFAQSSDIKYI